MGNSTVIKVDSRFSPKGGLGQTYLASGVRLSMRLWKDEPASAPKDATRRDYEVVGYVISGRAELEIEGQTVRLGPGDSYVVPRGAEHRYHVLEAFTAVEATSPPAQVHAREERDAHTGGGSMAV
jgi:quercetin dioxygenase-like cupin family protein